MKIKKISCSILIIFIFFSSFVFGYNRVNFVYADAEPLGYTQATTRKQLTDAFLAYCKTRDSELTSSVLGVASTYAYSIIQKASQNLGFNIDDLQASLYYYQANNSVLRWYMTSSGISTFNNIFAYLIQENGLEIGDTDVNEQVYSGKVYTDKNGNSCFIYIVSNFGNVNSSRSRIDVYGSPYLYTENELKTKTSFNVPIINNGSGTIQVSSYTASGTGVISNGLFACKGGSIPSFSNSTCFTGNYSTSSGTRVFHGHLCIGLYNSKYYVCLFNSRSDLTYDGIQNLYEVTAPYDNTNKTVYFISNEISNYYTGDTVYNDNGIIINGNPTDPDENEPEPSPDPGEPGSGTIGGGGEYGDEININFPDIDFNIPDINFSLGDLSNKFPFSIPSDYKNFVGIFNKTPIAPAIQGDIPLGSWYTWHFDADFSQFDEWASLFRTVELASFCFALVFITIKLIKG